jgi:predicted RNA binding protein YcfA (HicA-like mRNA interferase family)
MKASELLRVLTRHPLNYRIVRQRGSHRRLEAPGRQPLTFAFHDGQTLPPGLVRKVLTRDAGLNEDDALSLL